jgi:uncharacterized membrane protein
MNKNRLEAFSDGVFAILITIMVLELKIPNGDKLENLYSLTPVFISYIFSFIYVAIYWNNHHHMIHATKHVNGKILWANMHLLFWLSLIPFVTAWAGENHFSEIPVAFYGVVLFMSGLAYNILTRVIINSHDRDFILAKAIGNDSKGKISVIIYLIGIIVACTRPLISCLLYIITALIWLVPDRRIEKVLDK